MHVCQVTPLLLRRVLLSIAAALATSRNPLAASEVTLAFALHGASEAPSSVTLELRRIVRSSDAEAAPSLTQTVESTSQPVTINLQPGLWSISAHATQWWHRVQFISVRDAKTLVQLDLWPTAVLQGAVRRPESVRELPTLTARFQPAVDRQREPAGEVPCAQEGNTFQCELPAAALDVRIQAPGFIPRFIWKVPLTSHGVHKVGMIVLERGSSVIGTVSSAASPVGANLVGTIVVASSTVENADSRGGSLQRYKAAPSGKGFFHVDGLPAGQYTIVAFQGRQRSAPVSIRVIPGAVAELHSPLKLEIPSSVRISAQPALDPSGSTWKIAVKRSIDAARSETLANEYATKDGEWKSPPLYSGEYTVSIGPHDGGTWHTETVAMTGEEAELRFSLQARSIQGEVLLGDKPLSSRLTITDGTGSFTEVQTDDNGMFNVSLPNGEATLWQITVKSDNPPVRRKLQDVKIEREQHVLRIVVPLTIVMGDVVDAAGKPAAHAFVAVREANPDSAAGMAQVRADAAGRFVLYGLEPGAYRIHADDFLKQSIVTDFDLPGQGDAPELHLTLLDETKVHGHVVSAFGDVADAGVYLFPTDIPNMGTIMERTDVTGEFSGTVPPQAQEMDVVVLSSAFACKMVHTRVRQGTLTLLVEPAGGTLIVPAPKEGLHPVLVHGGAAVAAEVIGPHLGSTIANGRMSVPRMEPGPYSMCMLRIEQFFSIRATHNLYSLPNCQTGFLAPGGELSLAN
jgi:hypothetical protein